MVEYSHPRENPLKGFAPKGMCVYFTFLHLHLVVIFGARFTDMDLGDSLRVLSFEVKSPPFQKLYHNSIMTTSSIDPKRKDTKSADDVYIQC